MSLEGTTCALARRTSSAMGPTIILSAIRGTGIGTQGQGWLFSEPVSADMLESMVRNHVLSKAAVT